jgi:bacterioferritin
MEDQEFPKLAKIMKDTAIVEMKHAEALAERILFLKGTPISKPDAETQKGLGVEGILKVSAGLERQAIEMYNKSVQVCVAESDDGSKVVFEKLLADEEEHLNTFENMLDHVQKLGAAYIATLAG